MIQELIKFIQRGTVTPLAGLPAVVIPNDMRIQSTMHLDDYAPRKAGTIVAENLESLVNYIQRFATSDSAIFATGTANNITAILDWHDDDKECEAGGMARHQIILPLKFSDQWNAWARINGQTIGQKQLAEFIEEYLGDITEPDAAAVLETVLTLQGKKSVNYKNAIRLTNGDTTLSWEETTEAKAGRGGELKVPSELKITIPVYAGCEDCTTFKIRTMFRYNIADGNLTFQLKMLGIERIREMAFEAVYIALEAMLESNKITTALYRGSVTTTPLQIYSK
jgi:uncharacterized protein YfdQ (DUF2303 family)